MVQVFKVREVSGITSTQPLNYSAVFTFGEVRSCAGSWDSTGAGLGPKQRCLNREKLAWLRSLRKSGSLGDRVGRLIQLHQHFIWEF